MIETPWRFQDVALYPRENKDMDKQATAKALGIDLTKIDWAKVLQVVEFVLQLLATHQDKKAALAAVGCPDDKIDLCCEMCNCGNLSIEAAKKAFNCCHSMCGN